MIPTSTFARMPWGLVALASAASFSFLAAAPQTQCDAGLDACEAIDDAEDFSALQYKMQDAFLNEKAPEHLGDRCKDDKCCRHVAHAVCREGRCLCDAGYVGDEGKCMRGEAPSKPTPSTREIGENLLIINAPVAAEDVAKLLKPPLVPDLYKGHAWVTLYVYNIPLLENYVNGTWVDSGLPPYLFNKLNVDVMDSNTGQPGYLITSTGFEDNELGKILQLGAIRSLKVPSALGFYDIHIGKANVRANVTQHATNLLPPAFLHLKSHLSPLKGCKDKAFAEFIIYRVVKYLQQFDGSVVCSPELGEGSDVNLEGVQVYTGPKVDWSFLDLLGLKTIPGWKMCQDDTCFFQPSYKIVDHENKPLPCRNYVPL